MNRRHLGRILRLEAAIPERRWDFSHVPTSELIRIQRTALKRMIDKKTGTPLPQYADTIALVYGSFEAAKAELFEEQHLADSEQRAPPEFI
jgi:hypothetical protein